MSNTVDGSNAIGAPQPAPPYPHGTPPAPRWGVTNRKRLLGIVGTGLVVLIALAITWVVVGRGPSPQTRIKTAYALCAPRTIERLSQLVLDADGISVTATTRVPVFQQNTSGDAIDCVLNALHAPSETWTKLDGDAIYGSETWNGILASWTYRPDHIFTVVFTPS